MKKISGIYRIINIIDGKMLIGYAKDLATRKRGHFHKLKNNKHNNCYLQNAVNKHGIENFIFEIIEEYPLDVLPSMENWWCNMLNTHNREYGYNIKPTSPYFNSTFSKETLLKMSQKGIERFENNPLLRNKISESLRKYYNNTNYNKKSPYKKRSSFLKIKKYDKYGNFIKEYENFEEVIKSNNISKSTLKSALSHSPHKTGKGFIWIKEDDYINEESILSYCIKTNKKPIIQYDLNNNKIKEWDSIRQASKELHIDKSDIIKSCKNSNKTVKNFKFKYKNE